MMSFNTNATVYSGHLGTTYNKARLQLIDRNNFRECRVPRVQFFRRAPRPKYLCVPAMLFAERFCANDVEVDLTTTNFGWSKKTYVETSHGTRLRLVLVASFCDLKAGTK
jgi:hypothetical protein